MYRVFTVEADKLFSNEVSWKKEFYQGLPDKSKPIRKPAILFDGVKQIVFIDFKNNRVKFSRLQATYYNDRQFYYAHLQDFLCIKYSLLTLDR